MVELRLIDARSKAASRIDVATYFAKEPKPGEQSVIGRRAYATIKKGFDANGSDVAYPTGQVAGGEDTASAAIDSVDQNGLAKPAPAEG